MKMTCLVFVLALLCNPLAWAGSDEDPFLWLEEVDGEKALDWVKAQNEISTKEFEAVPEYGPIFKRTMEILDSQERIPMPDQRAHWIYNFWKDAANPRGLWRRTTVESYKTDSPVWEIVLDVDALVKKDGIPWVWKGAECLAPERRLCLVALSNGGSDAAVQREFDVETKSFVKGGFEIPDAKSDVSWRDSDHLFVGTDFGEGSLTTSGYPRFVKLWERGTRLEDAKLIYETGVDDVLAVASTEHGPDGNYEFITRVPVFYRHETFLILGDRLVKLDIPYDSDLKGFFKNQMLVELRSDWTLGEVTYPQGALIVIDLDAFLMGQRDFEILFEPSDRVSLNSVATTRNLVILSTLDNVIGRLSTLQKTDEGWTRQEITLPGLGSVAVVDTSDEDDTFFFTYEGFLTPQSLFISSGGTVSKIKSMPAFFDADGMNVVQYETKASDGETIPYFVVTPKGFKADGKAPTLLYGYGGFENALLPRYRSINGSAWMERGGVYVVANIRGGGEFGPRWHQAALKENRIKSFEDFISVAEDLIARKITSTKHLGIMGGSQGGLLVAGCMTLRPELFGAVVSQVPLADMKRFNKLLAGASWMGEYGDPDIPEEWAYIQTWSPYQLLSKDVKYPKAFFWTTTRDDRVHPGHARKMAAKMIDQGHPVYYFENIEGGHGSGSTSSQQAAVTTMEFAYLWKMLR